MDRLHGPDVFNYEMLAIITVVAYATDEEYALFKQNDENVMAAAINRAAADLGIEDEA
jgi:hypothetical protein